VTRFEPKIIVFNCNWCSYAGADLAGTSRLQYAPNIRIVRVMCSGRVEPYFVLEALRAGADGVLILGCHPGECHYLEGNYRTVARMALLKKMLAQFGVEDDRMRLDWVSASEGVRFAAVVNQMTEAVRALGPFQWNDDDYASPTISGQAPREEVAHG
jgi:F420-non-reducing hydrogenase iron-sulfur subunit